jgi:hypothetical protein
MKRIVTTLTALCAFALLAVGLAECSASTTTFVVASKANDGSANTNNGITSLSSTYAYLGKNRMLGWRFENVSIPKGAKISNAMLGVFCNGGADVSIKVKYSGESSDNANPLTTTAYDLTKRAKTSASVIDTPAPWTKSAWNNSPDLTSVVQEIVNRSGWQSGNALLLFAEDSGSSSSRSLRTVFMFDQDASYGAKLTITYDNDPFLVTKCEFDTNRDGIADVVLYDTDGDGYCELPAGKLEYNGTLVIDKPIEIVWNPEDPLQSGVLLKGHALSIAGGGRIVSELMLHNGSIANPNLRILSLEVEMVNGIEIEPGAQINLGGILDGDFDGDVSLRTTGRGAKIFLQGDSTQENTWLYGRNVTIHSEGSIYITDQIWVEGNLKVKLETPQGDINVSRESTVWAGKSSDIILNAGTPATPTTPLIIGNVNLSGSVELAGVSINMSGVTGTKNDDGTTTVIGTKISW